MTKPLLLYCPYRATPTDETGDEAEDWCDMKCIEGLVRGLDAVEGGDRYGEFIVQGKDGIERYKVAAAHTYPIPENSYTLVYYRCNFFQQVCIVGQSLPGGRFQKVSVLETPDSYDNLMDITEERRYILI